MFDPANVELPMRPERLRECLAIIGWSQVELSRRLNVRPDTAPDWAKGRKNIPYVAALWIELLAHGFALVQTPTQPWNMPWADDMSPNDLAAALHEIGWTHNEFARRLNCSGAAVHLMLSQARPIGADVAAWLRSVIRILQMTPLPAEWRSTGLQNSKDFLETATGEGGTGTLNR